MLASLDKINKTKRESKLLGNSEETKDAIIAKLNKLGTTPIEKSSLVDNERPEIPESLKKLLAIEKKLKENALALQEDKEPQLNPKDDVGLEGKEPQLNPMDDVGLEGKGPGGANRYSSLSNNSLNNSPSYLSAYFALIKNKANENWKNPLGAEILSETETNKKTIVSFNILRAGAIVHQKIEKSSGNHALDNLALRAVKNSNPLPPLPQEYREPYLRVFIDFNYSLK